MGIAYNTSIARSGLVLHLDAANKKSYSGTGTAWNDLSGNSSNGTLVNSPTYSAANNGAIVFDGANDYSSIPINLPNSSMTIELTFKVNAVGTFEDLAALDDGTSQLWAELGGNNGIPNTNGYLRYYGFGIATEADTNGLASASQYIIDSKVHTSVLTINSSSAVSYFNGIAQGTGSITASTTFTRLVLANDIIRGNSRALACNIYQVKLYNRAITAAEVIQNFEAIRGRYGI